MIRITSLGSFDNTKNWMSRLISGGIYSDLHRYGQMGVNALASVTPRDTGRTASSWTYGVERSKGGMTIYWSNTNVNNGAKIALLLQYGHGTGTGGYVAGYDYINPAIRPVFDQIADEIWKRVTHG